MYSLMKRTTILSKTKQRKIQKQEKQLIIHYIFFLLLHGHYGTSESGKQFYHMLLWSKSHSTSYIFLLEEFNHKDHLEIN